MTLHLWLRRVLTIGTNFLKKSILIINPWCLFNWMNSISWYKLSAAPDTYYMSWIHPMPQNIKPRWLQQNVHPPCSSSHNEPSQTYCVSSVQHLLYIHYTPAIHHQILQHVKTSWPQQNAHHPCFSFHSKTEQAHTNLFCKLRAAQAYRSPKPQRDLLLCLSSTETKLREWNLSKKISSIETKLREWNLSKRSAQQKQSWESGTCPKDQLNRHKAESGTCLKDQLNRHKAESGTCIKDQLKRHKAETVRPV